MLGKIEIPKKDIGLLKERFFEFGGESLIVKTAPDKVYKMYKDYIPRDTVENKTKKIEKISEMNLDYITEPTAILYSNGVPIGYEMKYDENDTNLLLSTLSKKEKIYALKKIKDILKYFESKGIIYHDINQGNILINKNNGKIKFCDIDNVTMEGYPGDLYDDLILFFKETYGVIDTRVHSFMHNYLTLSYLNDIDEFYDVMAMIKTNKYPKHVTKKNEKIVKSLVESDGTYKNRYIIDTIKTR